MQVTYTFITAPTVSQIAGILDLYRLQGWWGPPGDRDAESAGSIVRGSHCFLISTLGETVVGMARAISDRTSDAYIQDVVVHPSFRNRGIGSALVREVVGRLRQDGLSWIGLVAEDGTWDFYRRAGFVEMPGSVLMLGTKA
jgi:spermidine synthase